MDALVVYESMFGNTEAVARAIADGLRTAYDVVVVEVGSAPAVVGPGVALVVAGGPTHAFGLTRESTRAAAKEQARGGVVSRGIGLREWLDALPGGNAAAATFDTRVPAPVPGSAAKAAARRLRRLGFRVVVPPETFWVGARPGPLAEGELDRARRWGERLGPRSSRHSEGGRPRGRTGLLQGRCGVRR